LDALLAAGVLLVEALAGSWAAASSRFRSVRSRAAMSSGLSLCWSFKRQMPLKSGRAGEAAEATASQLLASNTKERRSDFDMGGF